MARQLLTPAREGLELDSPRGLDFNCSHKAVEGLAKSVRSRSTPDSVVYRFARTTSGDK